MNFNVEKIILLMHILEKLSRSLTHFCYDIHMKLLIIICYLFCSLALAKPQTVADYSNNVICNYLQTQPFIEDVRTNIHSGNASISCIRVKKIATGITNISNSPIKIDIQSSNNLICYFIESKAYRDDRRGHIHGGHSAISCIDKS